ncbi:MltR family transcriptional regulator [Lonepinella sp. BR2474]|uniref:MltR family transcriptional regulator n=1 Tax=Lonepinella sp. BR2474 TaxID=3434548 RepID=UPI003F6DE547
MLSEDPIYEKLNEASSIRGFITATVAIFDQAVDQLINRVFRKTDFAVQSVVESLFETSGPLFDLSIRLKVLLGLGVISHELFEDVSAFIQMKETLNNDEKEYDFVDHIVVRFAHSLNFLENKSLLDFQPIKEDADSLVFQMKHSRQEKLLRSCLILTVVEIYGQLQVESPL